MKIKSFGACVLVAVMLCGSFPVYAEESKEIQQTIDVETEEETAATEIRDGAQEIMSSELEESWETEVSVPETEIVKETETKEDEASADPVENFVRRLYTKALNRKADASGLKDWTRLLKSKENF